MITRTLQQVLESHMFRGKAIIVTGARQVGKSTLLEQIVSGRTEPVLRLNCDEPEVREALTGANSQDLRLIVGNSRIVIIDEAQRVKGIGRTLKLITDGMPQVQLLVTGSSSLNLLDSLDEPLTGRKFEYQLFPFATAELIADRGLIEARQMLDSRLVFGSYPDVVNHADGAKEIIMNLADSYLYKDLLAYDGMRKPALLAKLLTALALQVGSQVSYNEVAQTIGSDSKTVEKYIDLLEKCFIVFRLQAFSRNLRNELKKSRKVYFWDNGVRNAVIQNFAPLTMRADVGALWENFFVSERIKRNRYDQHYAKSYFWRTTTKKEIDYVEEEDGVFTAFELKWNPKKASTSFPSEFIGTYPVKQHEVITPENYWRYL